MAGLTSLSILGWHHCLLGLGKLYKVSVRVILFFILSRACCGASYFYEGNIQYEKSSLDFRGIAIGSTLKGSTSELAGRYNGTAQIGCLPVNEAL
jgi:hypothetical protein